MGFKPGIFLLAMLLSGLQMGLAQEIDGDAAKGKDLFMTNCASCHKLNSKMIGPALANYTDKRDVDYLVKWIINNKALRDAGNEQALAIYEEYNGQVMPNFPNLSEGDVMNILAYLETGGEKKKPEGEQQVAQTDGGAAGPKDDNTTLLLILGGILLFLVILLVRVKNTLKQVQGQPTRSLLEDANIFTRTALKNPRVLTVLTIVVAVVFIQQLYAGLMIVNVDQGYQPEQPIKFSHKLHAGENQINCSYCHYGARKSKHSNIPSAGVCMNCHMQIQEGPKYGKEEIAKIYKAVGWDPETFSYKEDYEQKPVKWVRIHKLPDLAYFNHAQHVTAGNLQCQTCHGPIQEMEEVYQYSSLTMGWCINCHREQEVQVKENGYYAQMHEKLKEKYGEDVKVTVEMIGGLECGKCHY